MLAFDKAVKAALDFAKKDGNTVVVVAADHGTGGLAMGNKESSSNYDKLTLNQFMDPLKAAKLTSNSRISESICVRIRFLLNSIWSEL